MEDVGYGIVPMAALGELVGVKTPVIDALITLASTAVGVDFRATGLNLERMGLAGLKAADLEKFILAGHR
jgi:opine dehydrogenase